MPDYNNPFCAIYNSSAALKNLDTDMLLKMFIHHLLNLLTKFNIICKYTYCSAISENIYFTIKINESYPW